MSRDRDYRDVRASSVVSLVALLSTVAFLLMGFLWGMWHPGWVVFFAIPITGVIVDIAKRNNPIAIVTGVFTVLSALVFFGIGLFLNIWHPTWLVFFAIPISGAATRIVVGDKYDKKAQPPAPSDSEKL